MEARGEGPLWYKSTHSGQGDCVEISIDAATVSVRHSQQPEGPQLSFSHREWEAFLVGAKGGEFDIARPGSG
jgi:Domain of unknown function (DUF397)